MELDLTPGQRYRAALAALLGNALEWYDFAVYGYVASDLGKAFFPAEVPGLQTVAAFGVFAVGYLMRPVGSLVLGPVGDLLGRRLMLSLSIVIMGFSSLLIGLLPTHTQIGVAAGVSLVLLRMLQGFSVGAEFTGSITYATEAAARGRSRSGPVARGDRAVPYDAQKGGRRRDAGAPSEWASRRPALPRSSGVA